MHAPMPAEVGELFGLDGLSRELSEWATRDEFRVSSSGLSGLIVEFPGFGLVSGPAASSCQNRRLMRLAIKSQLRLRSSSCPAQALQWRCRPEGMSV